MKLKIFRIDNKGGPEDEAVWLEVLADCNLAGHLLADTTFDDTHRTNLVRHTYWFPDRPAKKGDRIVLYTKVGVNGSGQSTQGKPLHRLFWNLDQSVWNNEGDTATLIEIGASAVFPVLAKV